MNLAEQVYDQLVVVCQDKLGVNWQRLKKVFDPAQNDFRNIEQAFGVRHGGASPDADATKVFVLSHNYSILLVDRASNRDSDLAIQEKVNALYSKADDIFKEVVRTKLDLYFVTHVDGLTMDEPEVLDNGAVLLTIGLDIKYQVDPY